MIPQRQTFKKCTYLLFLGKIYKSAIIVLKITFCVKFLTTIVYFVRLFSVSVNRKTFYCNLKYIIHLYTERKKILQVSFEIW